MQTENLTTAHITGTTINYLHVCHLKLWFFQNHIEMEHTSDLVSIGKLLHEESYRREKRKERLIDDLIRIDIVDKNGILHDVKSGKAMERAHEMQILCYLYLLKKKGVKNRKRVINYPRQRWTFAVELTPENELEVEEAI